MSALLAVLLLVLLMGIGVPIAWSFAGILAYLTFLYDVNLNTLMLQGFRSMNSVVLVALPLFILAGHLMQTGGLAKRIIGFVGRLATGRGGMGSSMVLASSIFGAISGTATAAVASIGAIMAEPLVERGYPRGHIAGLLGISSLLGILIPPSITMILFAVVTRQSVAACFAATIGPALLLIVGLILYNRFLVGRSFDEKPVVRVDDKPFSTVLVGALPALSIPVIILGGIYGGIFTPTEAAAVAVLAALIVGGVIYREFTLASLRKSIARAAETTGSIILILLFSLMISRILSSQGIPQDLTVAVQAIASSPLIALMLVIAVLIVAGALMDDVSVTVVCPTGAFRRHSGHLCRDRSQQPARSANPLHVLSGVCRTCSRNRLAGAKAHDLCCNTCNVVDGLLAGTVTDNPALVGASLKHCIDSIMFSNRRQDTIE